MRPADDIQKRFDKHKLTTSAALDERVRTDVLGAFDTPQATPSVRIDRWRTIMTSKITRYAAAAVIIIVAAASIPLFNGSEVVAKTFLSEAVDALADIQSVYMKAVIRSRPRDNFANIGLDEDFVSLEMWKRIDADRSVHWRIEKPGRVVVCKDDFAQLFIRPNMAFEGGNCHGYYCFDTHWCGRLLEVRDLLDNELQRAQANENEDLFLREEVREDGLEQLVLEVNVYAVGVCEDDYLTNKFISASDRTRVYYFDPATKLLEGFELYVHTDTGDVLVCEITDIEYNPVIEDDVFTLDIPDDVIWWKDAEVLPDNEKYEAMGPRETAQAFFTALAEEDWEEFLKFMPMSRVPEGLKMGFGGLEILEIGEPFQSCHSGEGKWFVPYKIKRPGGTVTEHNLALQKNPKVNRFVFDGGL